MINLLQVRGVLFFSIILFTAGSIFANGIGEQFAAGVQAYQNQQYDTAVILLEASLSGDLKSSEAYNNLGLAYYQKGDLGYAILNFERALRQNAYNNDARHNLKAARQHIDSSIKPVRGFWLFKAWDRLAYSMTSRAWAMVLWFFLFAAGAGFVLWQYSGQAKLRFWGIRGGLVFLFLAIFPMLLGFHASAEEHDSSWCIVLNEKAGIRTAPNIDGEDIMVVSAGVKAYITEVQADWYRIRLDNGVLGWLPTTMVARI